MEIKKFTRLSLLLALSVALNIIESYLPFLNGIIPGLKLGLANIVSLFVLYQFGVQDCLYISVLRVFLVGILRTGIFSLAFFFSFAGSIFSVIAMFFGKKIGRLSIIGVSVLGSIFHSIGQVVMAILLLQMNSMIYYLPWLLLFSIPTGIFVGIVCKPLIKYYDNHLLLEEE